MGRARTARTGAAAGLAAALAITSPALAARRPPGPTTGHRVEGMAAGIERLFVLGGGEVLTFDGDGNRLGRCAGFAAPPPGPRRPALGAPDAEEVLRAAGLPDDDSTPEAEDALADEGLGPSPRRRPQSDGGIVPRALAADGAAGPVWIATSSGMFQGDEGGCRPVALDGRDLLLVAAAGEAVVAATADLLFRRAPALAPGAAGGAADFTVAAGLTGRPRALAVWAEGTALIADDDGVERVDGDGATERILDHPTDALLVCGDTALALADDGVYRWTAGGAPARTADRPPVRALACGPSPAARFVATGLGVWTSPDGVTWTERRELLGRSVAGAATVGARTWLATDDGLDAVDLVASDEPAGEAVPLPEPCFAPPRAAQRRLGAADPAFPWPWVTAVLGGQRTKDRRAWQVMLLLTFPLGRTPAAHLDVVTVAGEQARRDQVLARAQADLAAGADGGDDDDEREAWLESILQEREALR